MFWIRKIFFKDPEPRIRFLNYPNPELTDQNPNHTTAIVNGHDFFHIQFFNMYTILLIASFHKVIKQFLNSVLDITHVSGFYRS